MRKYSIIIPVYNRPEELNELLESLTRQTYRNFEVLVIEDGSANRCEDQAACFYDRLDIQYFYKNNSGQGFTRNFGFNKAKGDYFIVFDSDCIIPPEYLQKVDEAIEKNNYDAFGGPDKAHKSFSLLQKAINYSMTSFFTTGGIRGRKKRVGTFHPRSFNMGISRKVFEDTKGYLITRMGEDLELSIRIIKKGYKVGLIPEAFVYHKRRTNFWNFFKQLHFFGRARINVWRFHPDQLKPVHTFPALFTVFLLAVLVSVFFHQTIFLLGILLIAIYAGLIFIDATIKTQNPFLAFLSFWAAFIQLTAYGTGFLRELFIEFSGSSKRDEDREVEEEDGESGIAE